MTQNKSNGRAAREGRRASAAARLAASKPCACGSVHVDGHKGGVGRNGKVSR